MPCGSPSRLCSRPPLRPTDPATAVEGGPGCVGPSGGSAAFSAADDRVCACTGAVGSGQAADAIRAAGVDAESGADDAGAGESQHCVAGEKGESCAHGASTGGSPDHSGNAFTGAEWWIGSKDGGGGEFAQEYESQESTPAI